MTAHTHPSGRVNQHAADSAAARAVLESTRIAASLSIPLHVVDVSGWTDAERADLEHFPQWDASGVSADSFGESITPIANDNADDAFTLAQELQSFDSVRADSVRVTLYADLTPRAVGRALRMEHYYPGVMPGDDQPRCGGCGAAITDALGFYCLPAGSGPRDTLERIQRERREARELDDYGDAASTVIARSVIALGGGKEATVGVQVRVVGFSTRSGGSSWRVEYGQKRRQMASDPEWSPISTKPARAAAAVLGVELDAITELPPKRTDAPNVFRFSVRVPAGVLA